MTTIHPTHHVLSRRSFLKAGMASGFLTMPAAAMAGGFFRQETYETHAKGIRILPGQWRPHYPWEHIAWVSPSWPSQDYLWIDLPEAIFTRQGLLFLSHVNPQFPVKYPRPPAVLWREVPGGLAYDRRLPSGLSFSALVVKAERAVDIELSMKNGSDAPLNDIRLQTCVFLRAAREFAAVTADNKLVHVPGRGWTPFFEALKHGSEEGSIRLGWRSGPKIADQPVILTTSAEAKRLAAFTWGADTYSLVCNPYHPCMHADPALPDLEPGAAAKIKGKVIFFEGSPEEFSAALDEGGVKLPP